MEELSETPSKIPGRERTQFLSVFHVVQVCEHLPEFVQGVGWQAFRPVLQVELLQALMDKILYLHP